MTSSLIRNANKLRGMVVVMMWIGGDYTSWLAILYKPRNTTSTALLWVRA